MPTREEGENEPVTFVQQSQSLCPGFFMSFNTSTVQEAAHAVAE